MASVAEPARSVALDIDRCAQRLTQGASLELNTMDVAEFAGASSLLRRGQRIYVSHLPRQTWDQTLDLCDRVAKAGFDPVPHVPVRLLADAKRLRDILRAAHDVGVTEPLLLAGDYATARGAFPDVLTALREVDLTTCGMSRVSFAGHPEGHPVVPPREMLQAQIDKWRVARDLDLQVSFVTQFFFDARPFTQWACELKSHGVQARLVAGLAGPAGIAKLLRLARTCGVGASLRALTHRPAALFSLLTDHDPGALIRDLAAERQRFAGLFDGVHLFSFGGFRRTATWLQRHSS